MHFQQDEGAPHPEGGLHRLPSLDQQSPDTPLEGYDTHTFRAILRGMTPEQAREMATRVTEPLPAQRPQPARKKSGFQLPPGITPRQIVVMALSLVVLLGLVTPLLGVRVG